MEKDLLSKGLDNALTKYNNRKGQPSSYDILIPPLQKADKLLSKNGISIFNLEDNYIFPQNLDGLGELTDLAMKVRNIIWKDNLGLVGQVAKKYLSKLYNITFEELNSEGNSGLLIAIKNHNYNLGAPFLHYAVNCIDGSIKRNLNRYRPIKLPANFPLNYKKLKYFENSFKEKFHHKPSDEELADFMGWETNRVKDLKRYKKNLNPKSLNFPVFNKDEKEIIDTVIDSYSSSLEDRVINNLIFNDFIKKYISKLPDESKSILRERLKNKTFNEIALCLNKSNLNITHHKKIFTKQTMQLRYAKGINIIKKMLKV